MITSPHAAAFLLNQPRVWNRSSWLYTISQTTGLLVSSGLISPVMTGPVLPPAGKRAKESVKEAAAKEIIQLRTLHDLTRVNNNIKMYGKSICFVQ